MDQRALTLVPVAAAELLEQAVERRIETDSARYLAMDLARREGSDTPFADVMDAWHHEVPALRARVVELEQQIERMNQRRRK